MLNFTRKILTHFHSTICFLLVQREVMKENETLKCEISSLKLKINDINKDLFEAVTWNTQAQAELVSVKRDKCLLESEIEGINAQIKYQLRIGAAYQLYIAWNIY